MSTFISRIDTPTIPAEAKRIITPFISTVVTDVIAEGTKKSKITIVTDSDNLYQDACVARAQQVKIQLGETKISLGNSPLTKSLTILSFAKTHESIKKETKRAINDSLKFLVSNSLNTLKSIIRDHMQTGCEAFIVTLESAIQAKKQAVMSSTSISPDNDKVKFVEVDYKANLNHLIERQGIHLFVGEPGTGKSEIQERLMTAAKDDMRYPISINASRSLTYSQLNEEDTRDYRYAHSDAEARAVLGVVLKLLSDDYYYFRKKSETLFIDELEDVRDQIQSNLISTLAEKKDLLLTLEQQIISSHTVFGFDAFLNDHTVDWLYELAQKSGKTIYVYSQKSPFKKPVVRVTTPAVCKQKSREILENGKKLAVFSDGKNQENSVFNAEVFAIAGIHRKYEQDEELEHFVDFQKIDAEFTQSSKAKLLQKPTELAQSVQAIFYNPAAKNGLSILDGEYSTVSVIAHGTVSPNDLIQAPGRFRKAQSVNLCFSQVRNRQAQSETSILTSMINDEFSADLTREQLDLMLDDDYLQKIAARAKFKQDMHENYEFTVLTILEHLGYEIEFVTGSEEEQANGSAASKKGSTAEKEARLAQILNAETITLTEANRIQQQGEHATTDSKRKLSKFTLSDFYCTPVVDQELLDFDNNGAGRRIINKFKLARAEASSLTINQQFKQQMILKFFETVGLFEDEFKYSNSDAKDFLNFLFKTELTVGVQSKKALDIFHDTFERANVSTAQPLSTITSVLKSEFNIKPQLSGKKKRQRAYTVTLPVELERRINQIDTSILECLITTQGKAA
ncbi:AAA family ATPase [Vibrio quintilis]|uniref:AAA domain (Dynein-related subfamily) n=1 Tax=Vibrio quintilis TaxID=1117707 RepID=A0A1M7Z0Y2_9VIBR|nr:AAA family ATPase [Vibrio quintilis]SHO58521.1 AAA domain (dynein-related subfamily) [Vibrio quintilis]